MSQQPQFKAAPVNIRRKTLGPWSPGYWARHAELSGASSEPYAARTLGRTRNLPAPPQAIAARTGRGTSGVP